jgi:hypothetical protein
LGRIEGIFKGRLSTKKPPLNGAALMNAFKENNNMNNLPRLGRL